MLSEFWTPCPSFHAVGALYPRLTGSLTSTSVVTFSVRFSTDNDKSNEDRQREEELLQQIQKLVETRDFLVDDVEFERLRCICVFVFACAYIMLL